jgi:hypothetical protein
MAARAFREERKMKKFSLALLAIATALAIPSAALAQTFDFSFTSNDGTLGANGTLVAVQDGSNTLQYDATSGTINNVFGSDLLITSGLLTPASAPGVNTTSLDGKFFYDDQIFPNQDPLLSTTGGLLFTTADGAEINIFATGTSQGTYEYYDDQTGQYFDLSGNFALTEVSVPEYGTLLMLILCALTLAGGFFFKSKQSGLILNS